MSEPGNGSAEVVLKRLDEQHQKYKFMEMNLLHKKRRYESREVFTKYIPLLRMDVLVLC